MYQRRPWWCAIFVLVWAIVGCETPQWKHAERYHRAVAKCEAQKKAFVRVMRKVQDLQTLVNLRRHLTREVLPKLSVYVASLRAIQPVMKDLQKIHRLRVEAYQDWEVALKHFLAQTTDPRAYPAASGLLVEQAKSFAQKERHATALMDSYKGWLKRI